MSKQTEVHMFSYARDTKFWDKIATKYAAKPVPDEGIYEKKLELTRQLLRPDMEVLEIGCGTGTTALKHAPYVKHITATDFSQEMIEIAIEKAREQGMNNVDFQCEDVESLERLDEEFDVILAHSILHLVPDKDSTIKQAYRLLKPGGCFISSTACITGLMASLRFIWPVVYRLGLVPSVQFFSEDELVDDHMSAGFEIQNRWLPSKLNSFIIARKPL